MPKVKALGKKILKHKKDIQKEQLEQEMTAERLHVPFPPNQHTSSKALNVLGHDPSTEKVKKTLGLDEEDLDEARAEIVEMEEKRLQKRRQLNTPYNKKTYAKAFSTLGFDPSMHRSMKLLGIKERNVKQALNEEADRIDQMIANSRKNAAAKNRKENKKALNVIGHDPMKQKVLNQLGEEASKDANFSSISGI